MWAGSCVKGSWEGSSEVGRVDKVQRTGVLGWASSNWWDGGCRQVQHENASEEWK